MKKRFMGLAVTMFIVCVCLQGLFFPALSEEWETDGFGTIIPPASLWGATMEAVSDYIGGSVRECSVSENQGLRTEGRLGDYEVDVYYVFGKDMGTYYGLSKVSYVLPNDKKRDSNELKKCREDFVDLMSEEIGFLPTKTKSVNKWETPNCTVNIGQGKFSAYTGYYNSTIGIAITGKDSVNMESNASGAGREKPKQYEEQEEESSQFTGPMVTVNIASGSVQIHKSFKDLMDSYEDFFDSYFMTITEGDYLQLLIYLEKLDEMEEALNELENADLTESEMAYYIEVHARILQKMYTNSR